MEDILITQTFIDRLDETVDRKTAIKIFLQKFEETEGNFQESFQKVADTYNITISEVQYLYHEDDWAMKIVQRETEQALVKQVLQNKKWLNDRDIVYNLGQHVLAKITKDFNEKGIMPFDIDKLRSDPKHMEKFLKMMKDLSSIQATSNDNITKSIMITQNNETIINTTQKEVTNDKINEILNDEGLIKDGEFKPKKEEKEEKMKTKDQMSKIKSDLYLTYKYLVSSNYANDVPAPHIKEISRYLMGLWTGVLDKHLAISVPPRHAIEYGATVLTSEGYKKHGELQLGDNINTPYGYSKIIGKTPPIKCNYKVHFSNGSHIISNDTHQWLIKYGNLEKWVSTKELYDLNSFDTCSFSNLYGTNFKITSIEKIDNYTYGNCIEVDNEKGLYYLSTENGDISTGNSKSSLVTLAYVAWLIMQDPTLRIMIITNSGTLSERFGLRLRDIFRRNSEFIGVDLSETKQAKTDFYFAYPEEHTDPKTGEDLSGEMTDGHVFITSKGGSVTGHDVDVLIIDDPYNGSDDLTPTALQKTINWFNEIVSQRIEPHTKFVILHTRWKNLADSTPILTPNGWKTHGELKKGDFVFGIDGEPVKIIGVSEKAICDRKVTFSNGEVIYCNKDHLWSVYQWNTTKKLKTLHTHELEEKGLIYEYKNNSNGKIIKRNRFSLPIRKKINFKEKKLPIDPYWLGCWIGDGNSRAPRIVSPHNYLNWLEYQPYEYKEYKQRDNFSDFYFTKQGLKEELKKLNLIKNKHIPQIYLQSSYEQRLALLAGLIDTDGFVENSGRVGFSNSNKKVISGVIDLITSLGFEAKLQKYTPEQLNKNKNSKIIAKQNHYLIRFQPRCEIPTQNKPITKELLGNTIKYRQKITIQSIEKVKNPEKGHCIKIDRQDGLYLAGKKLIPTHNTNDLIGHFKEVSPNEFIFLEYPAVNDDWTETLWKKRYSVEFFKKKRNIMGEAMFQAVYQQKPLDLSSDFFNMNKINWIKSNGEGSPITSSNPIVMKCRSWDIALKSGRRNDFTCGIPVYRTKLGHVLFSDFIYGKFGETTNPNKGKYSVTDMIKRVTKQDGVGMVQCIEIPGPTRDLNFEEYKRQLLGYRLHRSDHKNMAKEDRAFPLQEMIEAGKVYCIIRNPKLRQAFINEFSSFPHGKHNDIVDASSYGVNYLFNYFDQRKTGSKVGFFAHG